MLSGGGGRPDPQRVADVIRANPGERDAIMALLNQTLGMEYAKQVARSAQPGQAGTPGQAGQQAQSGDVIQLPLGPAIVVPAQTPGQTPAQTPGQAPAQAPAQAPMDAACPTGPARRGDPHTRPEPMSNPNYLANYTLLGSTIKLDTYEATDKDHEAPLLNKIRASNNRFEPDWTLALQKQLHVRETGAFNTDTLRAVRAKLPTVTDADFLSDTGVLAALVPGGTAPFRSIGSGAGKLGIGSTDRVSEPSHLADAGARALGYASYAALKGDLKPITFLGQPVRGGAHPHLAARLKLAEDWIFQRHGKDAKPADVGWGPASKPDAVASYHDKAEDINANDAPNKGPHLHAYGVAIDFDPDHNPFVFNNWTQDPSKAKTPKEKQAIEDNNWWVTMFKHEFKLAAQIYGGEPISADQLATWSERMSTEELFARVDQASKSFKSLLELGQYGTDTEIDCILRDRLHLPVKEAAATKKELRGLSGRAGFFKGFMGRDPAESITTHSNELLIALRDVAGLSWGGSEMSHPVNGDFMHFDIRQDPLGQAALNFALANQGVTTDKDATPAKADAK